MLNMMKYKQLMNNKEQKRKREDL